MPSATPAPRNEGPALELLVHGVGGATPEEMLCDPRTVRISGDEKAAVFRRRDDEKAETDRQRDTDQPIPEAYCWSNLTSGNSARALWLLLLPFMVVNLAHWMRPRVSGSAKTTRAYGVLVRLVALSLTVLLTAAACEVALDLVAWQCAGVAYCSNDRSWLGFLSVEQGGWWSQPGRRLALASLVPAALVGLLWYLSNRTWSAYESQRPPTGAEVAEGEAGPRCPAPDGTPRTIGGSANTSDIPATPAAVVAAEGADDTDAADGAEGAEEAECAQEFGGRLPVRPALGRPGFWYGRRLVARLRAAHTAAGFLTVAAAVAGAAARRDRAADSVLLQIWGWALEILLVLGLLIVLAVVFRRGRSERRFDARFDRAAVRQLPGAALGVLALSLLYACWSRPGWVSHGTLPGDVTFRVIALAQGVLIVSLGVVALALQRRARQPRAALRGLAGPAVAMLGCGLGGVMTGGIAQRVADWLDGPGTPGMDGDGHIPGPPVLLSWQASVIPVLLLLLIGPAVVLAVRTWLTARRLADPIEAEYAARERTRPDGVWRPDQVRTRRIASARARAAVTDAAPWTVGIVAGATLLLGAGAVMGAWATGEVPGQVFANDGLADTMATTAQALGSWLVGVGFILLVTWGRRAYRDAAARRTIGTLWDVGTFWPRAAHPFAPPCYAERAVPDLTWRMCTWTERTGGRLVISGHSQGSVLAAAAVWQLPAKTRGQVALLTYGSPLERLYGRWFPAYFGPGALTSLSDEVDSWRNLWRPTDPIGGPVLVPAEAGHRPVDGAPLHDPVVYGRSRSHPLPEPIRGHSDYQADPRFALERQGLLERLPPAIPTQQRSNEAPVQGSSGRSSG
ncbi:hypothetical protein [Streptomyces albipurpureus]|uniref:Integral membrane protein n=1 Tax=Streptomyces albipurpureus TaxID=2897419 RepID=A0ABT0UQ37_9ACTN|nr:hypothetical protein [Streptomyces sp. CWNU-1]MCM2390718.1 hypothetical protein [Streptomyces sp. CWNU-1]